LSQLAVIADNLSKAGWSWGCVSAIDSHGRTIWIADAHRGDGRESQEIWFLTLLRVIEILVVAPSPLGDSRQATSPSFRREIRERKARSHNQPINQIPPRISRSGTVLATSTPEIPKKKQCKDPNT
jgi:hypothetical protein